MKGLSYGQKTTPACAGVICCYAKTYLALAALLAALAKRDFLRAAVFQ